MKARTAGVLTHATFPKAILHVDGDSFFASCEVAKNPALRGKCVITGRERGIASSMSYEAKARGVTRGMRLSEIRKLIPDVVIIASDYETYSLYSRRMYDIVRRYTEAIEEYSIDECFADLTGMRRPNKMSYEAMAIRIKHDLDTELGMTFSVGLSVNKVTAKVASKWKKPDGLTIIPGRDLHRYLERLPIEKVWGIGPNTSSYLRTLGIITALDLAVCDERWIARHLSKPFQEIYRELNGQYVNPLILGAKNDYASISKTLTFTPPSRDKELIFSHLSRNIESACIKLRKHGLYTRRFSFFLKTQDFRYRAVEVRLSHSVSVPKDILNAARDNLEKVYKVGEEYRATGIVLMDLTNSGTRTMDLFGHSATIEKVEKIYEAVDAVSAKFGRHTVFLGSSLKSGLNTNEKGRMGLPFLGEVR